MVYQFLNTKTKEIRDIVMSMKDYKHYKGENNDESFWERLYHVPQMSLNNTKIDPFSSRDYVEKTGKMKGTYGDLLDASAELSAKRAEKTGTEDPIKRKAFNEYQKRVGKKHPKDKPKKIDLKNATIEF